MLVALLIAAAPNITWHGGKVLVSPRYHNLYWGSYWAGRPDHVAWLDSFTAEVAPSWELASQVAEYSLPGQRLGPGSFGGSALFRDGPAPIITDRGLEDFIHAQILAGAVPPADEHNVYAVFLPPGVKIEGEERAVGYHTRSAYGFYEIMVHFDSYGSDAVDRNVAGVIYSHEMAETMTDPGLDAWYDSATREEISDVCQQKVANAGPHIIQQEWSNAEQACSGPRNVAVPPELSGACPSGTARQGSECMAIGRASAGGGGCSSAGLTPPALTLALLFARRRRRAS